MKAFNIGNGCISVENILCIFQEEKLFIHFVDKIHLNEKIKMEPDKLNNNEYVVFPKVEEL